MTAPDMHTLSGAYAVNAVNEHERAQFERHLAQCGACAQEARELQATTGRLGASLTEEPPAQLKPRVLAAVSETRQESPAVPGSHRARHHRIVPRWILTTIAAAAVIGIALAGVSGTITLQTTGQLNAAQQRVEQLQRYAPLGELLSASDTSVTHADTSIGGGATVLGSASLNKLMFLAAGLPEQSQGQTYQLWLIADGQATPAGLLPDQQTGPATMTVTGLPAAAQIGLTIEPEGGSAQPTSEPILLMDMPA